MQQGAEALEDSAWPIILKLVDSLGVYPDWDFQGPVLQSGVHFLNSNRLLQTICTNIVFNTNKLVVYCFEVCLHY